jgi:hypothetical protein
MIRQAHGRNKTCAGVGNTNWTAVSHPASRWIHRAAFDLERTEEIACGDIAESLAASYRVIEQRGAENSTVTEWNDWLARDGKKIAKVLDEAADLLELDARMSWKGKT